MEQSPSTPNYAHLCLAQIEHMSMAQMAAMRDWLEDTLTDPAVQLSPMEEGARLHQLAWIEQELRTRPAAE